MLDKVATEKTDRFANKPIKPWFNTYIRDQRKIVKNRDLVWRKYRQQHQWQAYTKTETYTIACLSTTRNKSYENK